MNRMNILLVMLVLLLPPGSAFAQETSSAAATETGVDATKAYLVSGGGDMLQHVTKIQTDAQAYFDILSAADFDYQAAWAANKADLTELVSDARGQFILAHNDYEHIEGIVAGVPSLADFDGWIDAGLRASEDPENAYDWTLTLDDWRSFYSRQYLHWLLETTLWGTQRHRPARASTSTATAWTSAATCCPTRTSGRASPTLRR